MVITLSQSGMQPESTLRKVVFPLPVPPLMKILYPARTSSCKNSAASRDRDSQRISSSRVMGLSGKRRMVTMGPFKAMGFITIFTLAPPDSRASTMGDASLTILLQPATICWITSWSFSSDSKRMSSSCKCPARSTNILLGPLIMISVTSGSSIRLCNISSRLRE